MIKPINQAPRAFAERYNRILHKKERLDTLQQLAGFWRFAIEQGKPHPEMREYIANCVIKATNRPGLDSPIPVGEPIYEVYDCWEYCARLSNWAPKPGDTRCWRDVEEFYDYAWNELEYWAKELNDDLNKRVALS